MNTMIKEVTPNEVSPAYLRYVIGLMFVINLINYMDRSVINVLIEPMRKELQLSDSEIGLVVGLSFAAFYAIAGFLLANMADRRSRRLIISLSIAAWGAMTALTGAVQNVWQLFIARMGVGVGEAGVVPASTSLLSDYFPPQKRAWALGLFSSGSMAGVMLGAVLGGYIVELYGWRWAFVVAALPALPVCIITLITLRDPQRSISAETEKTLLAACGQLFANRSFVLLVFAFAMYIFVALGVMNWMPTYLLRKYDLPLSTIGNAFGGAVGVGTILGSILGAFVSTKLAVIRLSYLTLIPLFSIPCLWVFMELSLFVDRFDWSISCILLATFLGGLSNGSFIAAMQTSVPSTLRTTAAGISGLASMVIGVGLAPLLVGLISDQLKSNYDEAARLQWAMAICLCFALVAWWVMWLAHKQFRRITWY